MDGVASGYFYALLYAAYYSLKDSGEHGSILVFCRVLNLALNQVLHHARAVLDLSLHVGLGVFQEVALDYFFIEAVGYLREFFFLGGHFFSAGAGSVSLLERCFGFCHFAVFLPFFCRLSGAVHGCILLLPRRFLKLTESF